MTGPSVARLRHEVQYQNSITSAHKAEMYEHVQKAPFDLIQLLEKRYWDSSLEECLTVTSIQPMFLSSFPLLPPASSPQPTPGHKSYPSKRANPEAKSAFNLGLIVKASNLQSLCVISFYWRFSFN